LPLHTRGATLRCRTTRAERQGRVHRLRAVARRAQLCDHQAGGDHFRLADGPRTSTQCVGALVARRRRHGFACRAPQCLPGNRACRVLRRLPWHPGHARAASLHSFRCCGSLPAARSTLLMAAPLPPSPPRPPLAASHARDVHARRNRLGLGCGARRRQGPAPAVGGVGDHQPGVRAGGRGRGRAGPQPGRPAVDRRREPALRPEHRRRLGWVDAIAVGAGLPCPRACSASLARVPVSWPLEENRRPNP
jgi:hypothetical protein